MAKTKKMQPAPFNLPAFQFPEEEGYYADGMWFWFSD